MKTIEIKITDPDKEQQGSYTVLTEENRGGAAGWHRVSAQDGSVNSDPIKVNILGNQRIVIDPFPQQELEYDRGQGAAFNPRAQRNQERRIDRAEDKADEKAEKMAEQAKKQEEQRLEKAAKLQGGPVPPTGQATPPTSTQAAQPSSGPGGAPLEGGSASSVSGPQTVQEPRSTTLSPEQEKKKQEEEAKAVEAAEKQAESQRVANAAAAAQPKTVVVDKK